jgi:outer membrane protein
MPVKLCKRAWCAILPALLALLIGCAPSMTVAESGRIRIGLIDRDRILRECKAAQDARAAFAQDVMSKRRLYQETEEQVRAMQRTLKETGRDLDPALRREKIEQFEQEMKDLKRLKADLEEELKKKDAQLAREILVEVSRIVEAFRKEQGYTIILERKTVVAADDAIDITDDIIRLYDARMH